MARPTKFRRVEYFPETNHFVPIGKPRCGTEEVELKVEELEAMRLKDTLGLNQEECAKKMMVSRQTFQNIIDSGRSKVTQALIKGSSIRINGGHYTSHHCRYKCLDCESVYEINYEQDKKKCPTCGSNQVACNKKLSSCKKWCQGAMGS